MSLVPTHETRHGPAFQSLSHFGTCSKDYEPPLHPSTPKPYCRMVRRVLALPGNGISTTMNEVPPHESFLIHQLLDSVLN
uniref:Uncharacterized protein K0081B11.4 n=1 Tax=Oryza sativa subsp. indica TaxID=39946 RepID=C8TF45_ORYSI|nr:hypothetical protein [Oryza sativa Indica Group]BAI39980.1 hypothetical protein [Oryza sativa Indica Group]